MIWVVCVSYIKLVVCGEIAVSECLEGDIKHWLPLLAIVLFSYTLDLRYILVF